MKKRQLTGAGLFSLLLRLYPPAFRETFEEEMQEVFAEKIDDERGAGAMERIGLVLRELGDLTFQALEERMNDFYRKENPMSENIRRVRIFSVLSPVLLSVFLLVINPRYILRIFSDLLGWEILLAVVLGVCIGLLLWFAQEPRDMAGRLREGFVLLILLLMTNLFIILGPALVMVFGSGTTKNTPAGGYASVLRWILFGLIGFLALVAAAMAVKRVRAMRGQAG
jgi:hypothetical protein